MKELKFQILFFYYNRPRIAKNFGLKSVLQSSYPNWTIDFIDDSTDQDGDVVVNEFFGDHCSYLNSLDYYGEEINYKDKIRIYKTGNVREAGQSIFGKFANQAMEESDADISLMLCDDDALLQDYLLNLKNFYIENPEAIYSYSHLLEYDPSKIDSLEDIRYIKHSHDYSGFYLNHREPLNPNCRVDSSQVSWRRRNFLEDGMKFPFPKTRDLDAFIYKQMFAKWGACHWNKLVGEYKGWFDDQLMKRSSAESFNVRVK